MARANFVKSAQKNIYQNGKHVKYTSKKGKREGQELTKLDKTVPKDNSDPILIAKGESYYWWAFKNGGKHFSKSKPKASQLTQSAYLSELYSIQEDMETIGEGVSDAEELSGAVEEIKERLESLKDQTEESLNNMPDSLQQGPTGELLQERVDALENAINELESIDLDYEDPSDDDIRTDLATEIDEEKLDRPDEDDENFDDWDEDQEREKLVTEEMIEEKKIELREEWIGEKCDELSNISFE